MSITTHAHGLAMVLMACALAACSGVKPQAACIAEGEIETRFVGIDNIHIGDRDYLYGKFHLVSHSPRKIEFLLAYDKPVLIVYGYSARIERFDPGADWVWNVPVLEELESPANKVSIGSGEHTDLYVSDGTFNASNHASGTYRLRISDVTGCRFHSASFVLTKEQ